ncbi:g-protein coupled receptor GRL101 [Caerostris darwini]|uniref:G-protein coupled receptor GRL101 n=1 Tax=Caerostris darwini TaxID=1538125 RepID=A0AAV4W7K5_9ARAC|nr:g-protein coupled receptor GRL101 [Caerostris darwini]
MKNILFSQILVLLYLVKLAYCRVVQERNCRDLWNYQNARLSGSYQIDVDGDGPLRPIWIECDMGDGRDPHQVLTVVHHDTEKPMNVRGFESSGSYVRNITYKGATEAHLIALIDLSFSCQQYIRWSCKGAMFGFWYPPDLHSWWVGRNWKNQYFWGGAETDSRSCGCHPYCHPTRRNSTCNCDDNNKLKWLYDSGLILDSSRLPVLQLRFGDTGEPSEAGEHTLGPLICRATGHREIFMGVYKAPVTLTTPGYEVGSYPPPFYRYTWSVKIPEGETMELVFPEYDVVHFGSYNAVPGCRSVVTVRAEEENARETVLIMRQKSPPYYASEGSQTTVNITLTTCNQDPNVKLGKGFKAYVRRTECGGCNPGLGLNEGTTYCSGVCGIIASEEYPFPPNYYFSSEVYYFSHSDYNHTWILRVLQHYVVELEFSDFDVPAIPGSRNCTAESGVLWIYSGEGTRAENLIGGFCNLNREGIVYSTTNIMTLVFATRWRKVGNGRGFYAVYRGVHKPQLKRLGAKGPLPNVAEGKPAKQSSTLDARHAYLAVDGNTHSATGSAGCAATEFERDPWWQVNLQKRFLIYGFELYSAKTDKKDKSEELIWPDGQYGLPMPVSGCPVGKGFNWMTGYRYQEMQYDIVQDSKVLHWTPGMLLKGGLHKKTTVGGIMQRSGVTQHFCMKTRIQASYRKPRKWPKGEYCILQYGMRCPEDFKSGYITFKDTRESTFSDIQDSGYLPTGNYTLETTRIYYCCRGDASAENMIQLPNDAPFYLLKYGKSCQKVEGMSETEQFFHFNEDVHPLQPSSHAEKLDGMPKYRTPHPKFDDSAYEKGIALYYCYYDISESLRGFRVAVDDAGLIDTFSRYYDEMSYGIPHTEVGKFLNAYTCHVYPVTNPEFDVLKVNCSQAIYGQYVTLQIYNRFDSLQFCEMKVFAADSCGQPLGMASEEIFDIQISATSSDDTDRYYHTNGRLNANYGWCANLSDSLKQFTIDLQNITIVTGIVLQGLNGAPKRTTVKEFYIFFSNDSVGWVWEEEPVGQQKVYICDQCESPDVFTNDLEIRFNLLKGIPARIVQIKIIDFYEQPCLRVEILGCREKAHCGQIKSTPQGEVSSPNYPRYYGQDKSCWWTIEPEPGKHIELNFIVYDLAAKEDPIESGRCRDELTVYSGYGNSSIIKSPDGKLFPKRIISNGLMKIHLQSCFRNSRSRYRGFYARYKSVECPGCGVGDFQCSELHVCESPCGKIVSIGHPLNYQNNHRCRWLIRTEPSHFINLTLQDFDIVGGENCQYDYLAVYDGDTIQKSSLIGKFCNMKKPPTEIVSSWNSLLLEFSSDAETNGRGFSLKFASKNFQMPADIHVYDLDDELACPPPWKYYNGNCYNVFHADDAIQWYEAEDRCRKIGGDQNGHLVSILDKKENAVVHYFLTNFWNAKHKSLYIGLNDEAKEGVYRWSDWNPMIYTDWASAGRSLRTQPDGGAYQDCTMLRVDSGHPTAHWHDIPCSLGKLAFHNWDGIDWGDDDPNKAGNENEVLSSISDYICKMKSDRPAGNVELIKSIPAQIGGTAAVPMLPSASAAEKYFLCRNKEIISTQFVCNLAEDCRDGSDEETCSLKECPKSSFRCHNTKCVSIAAYCDYKDDCGDLSDEFRCQHRECLPGEFQCRNGQCISEEQRCDLLPNCYDKSDEHDCKGFCNPNSTFQCYDGTCIPRYTLCDGHRDCPGKYHEDEQYGCSRREDRDGRNEEKKLCSQRNRKTCLDLFTLDNIRVSGYYTIDSDGSDGPIPPFKVFCRMGRTRDDVVTIVHHDSEESIYVRSNKDGPGSYSRVLVYSIGIDKIKALTNASKHCRQEISWQCAGTGFHFDSGKPFSWWVSWDGKPQYIWGGAKKNNTCGCAETGCRNPNHTCNCDDVPRFEWNKDEGYLQDKKTLPVSEVRFGYTFRTGQYGYHRIGPLECLGNAVESNEKCTNTTRYMKCNTGHYVPITYRCRYEFDPYGYHLGCRDVTHLRHCESFVCPEDYVKCPESYCIPTIYVCDGKWDCIGGGDEEECDRYSCPGQYKCYNKSSCLPLNKLCDEIRNCPHGDDELLCDLVCPKNCMCVGLFVSCMRQNASTLPRNLPHEMRKLDFSFNRLDLLKADFSKFWTLGELILQYNYLTTLPPKRFRHLINLYKLDLSHNRLTFIAASAFAGLTNVRLLILENNPTITEIEPEAFSGLSNLPTLNLTGISLKVLKKSTFNGMSSLRTLNLENDNIAKVESGAFVGLHSVTVLDIKGNDIVDFTSYIFTGLKSLEYLYSDSYTFCCMASNQVPLDNCLPPPDEISSCEDLMSSPVQRSFLWVLGIIALVGNLFVIIWRYKTKDSSRISSILILSLGCADFLMGVYLIIIASVDVYYRSIYIENSDKWKRSTLCKICGFLSTVSSEVSVFTLVFITADRLISLCFPLSHKRFSKNLTYKLIMASWVLACVMAAIPFFVEPYFQGRFYARSGVCLALHITNHRPAGWEYSVAIFFCMNFIAFVIIVSAYLYMFITIKKSYQNMSRLMSRQSMSDKIGRQMALIVLTNSMCWFPIIVMGLLAMSGVNITGEAYSWTAIFVLPLNSATNPLIYTISSLHFQSRLLSRFGLTGKDGKGSYVSKLTSSQRGIDKSKRIMMREQLNSRPFKPPHGYISLLQYLRTVPGLRPKHLLRIATNICQTLAELHSQSYALGGIDVNAVFVSEASDGSDEVYVYVPDFNAYKITSSPISGMPDDTAVDMEEFGLLVKKMLRVYHVVSRSNDPMQGTAC